MQMSHDQKLFDDIGLRTQEFMRNMLEENRKSALELKREYELGLLDPFDLDEIRLRLLTQSQAYKSSFISFAFSGVDWGTGELYAGVERGLLPGKKNEQIDEDVTTSFVFKHNSTDLFYYNIDKFEKKKKNIFFLDFQRTFHSHSVLQKIYQI